VYTINMNTIIKITHTSLPPTVAEYIEVKMITSLERLIGKSHSESACLTLDIGKSTRHHKKGLVWRATGNLSVKGRVLRAKAEGERAKQVVEELRSELERELKTYKGKRKTTALKGARLVKEREVVARAARS
jgi:ribosome-associated translation inhibitor RaiA